MIVKVTINGNEYEVSDSETVLNTCLKLDIFIPHLCYLKGFAPAGVCGLCAVEFDGGKVALSCLTSIKDGMNIKTESKKLTEVRKVNIDKILKNHNIDCLNCSRNGVCNLQNFAYQIYSQCKNPKPLDSELKFSKIIGASEFIYDNSKCIRCQKCVKFLNKFCGQELKNVDALDSAKNLNNLSLNVVEICPTNAIDYEKGYPPEFLMEKFETSDISDVFTPEILVFKYYGKIRRIKSAGKTLISNRTRLSLKSIPERYHNEEIYRRVIDNLSRGVISQSHEKRVFVVGDNLDIVSLFYLKVLEEKFPNVCVCMNDCLFPNDSEFQIGFDRSELPAMDYALFIGNISEINKNHITSYSSRIKGSIQIDIDFNNWDLFANISTPILFVDISEFSKDNFSKSLYSIIENYKKEYGSPIKVRVVPNNVSQMLIKELPSRISINNLMKNFNKHDLQFICVVGDLSYELETPDIPTIYHSVFQRKGNEYIPAKHFVEDSTYYLNIFREVIKTRKVASNDLKSHREFLFDLMLNIFGEDEFSDINYDIHALIRSKFFG